MRIIFFSNQNWFVSWPMAACWCQQRGCVSQMIVVSKVARVLPWWGGRLAKWTFESAVCNVQCEDCSWPKYLPWDPSFSENCISDWYSYCMSNVECVICFGPLLANEEWKYLQTSNIGHSLVWNKVVDHSDVVGASPVGAAPTTSSFST